MINCNFNFLYIYLNTCLDKLIKAFEMDENSANETHRGRTYRAKVKCHSREIFSCKKCFEDSYTFILWVNIIDFIIFSNNASILSNVFSMALRPSFSFKLNFKKFRS